MRIHTRMRVRLAACLVIAAAFVDCGPREDAAPAGRDAAAAEAPSRPARSSETTATNSGAPRIVVLGDSLTAGLGLRPEEAYPAVLQRFVDTKNLKYQVINAGNSGDTSAAGLARLDWAIDDKAGEVRILIVALGANDGLRGLPVSQLRSNLARIIERAQARKVTVVLAGMEAPPNWGDEYTKAFHDVYPSLAKEYHVALVPFLLQGVAAVDGLNQRDGIHPTAEGDRIVAETVWKVLEPIVVEAADRGRRTGVPRS